MKKLLLTILFLLLAVPSFAAYNQFNDDVNMASDLTVEGEASFEDLVEIAGALGVTGEATLSGGIAASSTGAVLQMVSMSTALLSTGITVIPDNDTIPQITEGDQYLTLAITPKSATSILIIEAILNCECTTAGSKVCVALFQDATVNAIACSLSQEDASRCVPVTVLYRMVAGTTSATTFTVRAGGAAGTLTVNGVAASRFYGGVLISSMTITEIGV